VTRDEATSALGTAGFFWVHFDDCDTEAEEWLNGPGKLVDLIVSALAATETRPRVDAIDGGALVNLQGPDADIATNPDMLSSIHIWVAKGCVFTVTRRDLAALDAVEELIRDGKVLDSGDFVALLASEITAELDRDVAELGNTLVDCEEMVCGRHAFGRASNNRQNAQPRHWLSLVYESPADRARKAGRVRCRLARTRRSAASWRSG
jgi:zinc transporter